MRSIMFALALGCVALTAAPGLAQTGNPPSTTVPPSVWEKIKGSWTDTKGVVKEQWGKLTDDDLLEIEGRRDQLIGKIQVRYGVSREEAERQVQTWERRQR